MTSQEREAMYISNCLICSLAERMKDCKACQFRAGLEVKAVIKAAQEKNTVFPQNQTKGE